MLRFDNKPNLSNKQFEQNINDCLFLGGHNCICSGGTISSDTGYGISGVTIFNTGTQLNSLEIGCNTLANNGSIAIGANAIASGISDISLGYNTTSEKNGSIAIGSQSNVYCDYSTIIGYDNKIYSNYSNIFGGCGNIICSGSSNTTIIGLNDVVLENNTYSNYVIVPNLAIINQPNGNGDVLCYNQSSGKIERTNVVKWSGNTVGGIGVYVNDGLIYSQPKLKYDANGLQITGKTYINGLSNRTSNYTLYYDSTNNEIIYGQVPSGGVWSNLNSGSTVAGCGTITPLNYYNTVYGVCALSNITTGARNVAIGYCASRWLTTGSDNIIIGYCANSGVTTNCGVVSIGSKSIGLGNSSIAIGCNSKATSNCSIAIGNNTFANLDNTISIGTNTGIYNSGIYQIAIGYCVGNSNIGPYQISIGNIAGYENSGSTQTAIGYCAGYRNSGSIQIAIGQYAGINNRGSYQNVIGSCAGFNNLCNYQIAIGHYAGFQNSGSTQIAIGVRSGCKNVGLSQIAIGCESGGNNIGIYQHAIGYRAGYRNSGTIQIAIGSNAGGCNIGDYQIGIGSNAGYKNSGSTQIAIGYDAGFCNAGINEIAIGQYAGVCNTGNYTVFIGKCAGYRNTEHGKFIIKQSDANNNPLICGNFISGEVTIPSLTGATSSALGVNSNGTLIRISSGGTGGGVSWVGNVVGGIGTYVDDTTICSQPNIKYISNELHITGKTFINGLTNAQTNNVVYYDINTNELKQSNLINGNNAATLFNDNGVVGVTNLYWDDSVSGFTWGTGYTPTNNDIFTIIKDHDYHDTGYDGYITFGTCSYEMLNGTNLSIGYCADYNYECILGYNKINSEIPLCINSDVLLLPNYRITTTNYANFVNNGIRSSIGSVINGFVFNNNLDSISKEYVTRYEYIKCLATSDASPNVIWNMVLSGNKFANLLYNICVTGIGAVSGDSAAFILNGLIKYTCCGDLITFVGTPTKTTYKDSSMSVADVDVCLLSGPTSRSVGLYICGVSSKNIVWSAFVDALKTDLC